MIRLFIFSKNYVFTHVYNSVEVKLLKSLFKNCTIAKEDNRNNPCKRLTKHIVFTVSEKNLGSNTLDIFVFLGNVAC